MLKLPHHVLIAALFAACAAEVPDSPADTARGTSLGPAFRPYVEEVAWRWNGCGPSATPIALALTVDVTITPDSGYKLAGRATGCQPFDASDELRVCKQAPGAPARELALVVSDALGVSDTRSLPVVDCVDGKQKFPPPLAD